MTTSQALLDAELRYRGAKDALRESMQHADRMGEAYAVAALRDKGYEVGDDYQAGEDLCQIVKVELNPIWDLPAVNLLPYRMMSHRARLFKVERMRLKAK